MPRIWVGEIQMYYELHGEGEPLVLIHGLGSSSRDWEMQIPFFAQRYRVLCLDLRGHGRTDKPHGPYSLELFAGDVARLLRKLRLEPAHICGISLGGAVAYHVELDHTELVRTLTIVSMGAEIPLKTPAQWRTYLSRYVASKVLAPRKVGQILAPRLFPKPGQESLRETMIERWAENDRYAYLAAMTTLKNWSVKEQLHRIHCPTHVIAGDEDYSPVAWKEDSVQRLQRGELTIIDDARHALPVERPQEFNEAVLTFLEKHSS